MIYLQAERKMFEEVKKKFKQAYLELLEKMYETMQEKGEVRDQTSPIHHRIPPAGQLALAQAKCRRIEALLTTQEIQLGKVIEECTDAANYLLFISALCLLLAEEEKGELKCTSLT